MPLIPYRIREGLPSSDLKRALTCQINPSGPQVVHFLWKSHRRNLRRQFFSKLIPALVSLHHQRCQI